MRGKKRIVAELSWAVRYYRVGSFCIEDSESEAQSSSLDGLLWLLVVHSLKDQKPISGLKAGGSSISRRKGSHLAKTWFISTCMVDNPQEPFSLIFPSSGALVILSSVFYGHGFLSLQVNGALST